MLKLTDVCAGYDGKDILKKVSLHIPAGKITILAGANGCGKSTLLKTMAGMIPKTFGKIQIDGKNLEDYRLGDLAKKIAYLPQSRNVPEITVLRMVLHGRFPYLSYPRRYGKKDMEIARKALRQVGMEEHAEKNISQLSGGMQQKVYIAMALAQDTPVIMMDEPTSFLDISYQIKLMEMARELADQGKTVVLVLHDLALALRSADQMVLLENGQVQTAGTPEEVFQSGVLDRVFQLKIRRVLTEEGWQYYYISEGCLSNIKEEK